MCCKIFGIAFKLAFLYAKLAIILWFMRKLPYAVDVQHFARSVFGIYLLYALVYEPIVILVFSLMFSKLGGRNWGTRIFGACMFGNFHPNLINGLIYAVNNDK